MPAGRPTLYNDSILEKTNTYLVECVKEKKLPSIARLSRYLLVARSSIYEWKKGHQDFSDILDQVLSEQEASALEKGLDGSWNATIVKLLLGKHGYHDKQDIKASVGLTDLTEDELNRKLLHLESLSED